MKRLRLLVIAPFVSRASTGEGHSAYQWISRLAQRHDLTLLTYHLRADQPAREQLPEATVVEWPDIRMAGRFPRINSQLTPGYIPFYFRARRWLEINALSRRFDLVHQLAPLALRYPCPATGLGVPYLVGPLAGSLDVPPALRGEVLNEPLHRRLRNLDLLRFRWDPLLRATYSGARALICVAPYVPRLLQSISLPAVHFMSEAGVERVHDHPGDSGIHARGPLRMLFVGRVIRTKGVREAIEATSRMRHRDSVLDIVGHGEDIESCRALAVVLGLGDRVRFHGAVAASEVEAFYRQADVFVFPSFREPSGKALIEAMSHALPAIAIDHGGPAITVDDSCGRMIQPAPTHELASRFACVLDDLASHPEELARLGRNARTRVAGNYLWDKKVDWLCELYSQLTN